MDYDLIGDIHGQYEKLVALLRLLGYREQAGVWRHPTRTAIFLSDFIDRGARGVEVVQTARAMVDGGAALAVVANHELNAIAWHSPDPREPGEFLRPRFREPFGPKNRHQHQAFLAEVEHRPALHAELIGWFMELPLYIDLPDLRVVHACWHQPFIDWLRSRLREGRFLTPEVLVDATTPQANPADKDTDEPSMFKAVEMLTKGMEMTLPADSAYRDVDGTLRHRVRTRWWDPEAVTYRQLALLPTEARAALSDERVPDAMLVRPPKDKPIFFGHYWMEGEPRPQTSNAVCVDYSAGRGGSLVAYRFNAGEPLSPLNFVSAGQA